MTDTISNRPLRVFLCHASNDKPAVRDLHRRLSADGFAPWLDEEDLLPGEDWQYEIPKAVRQSDVVIVCLSSQSGNKTGYLQKEIKFALDVADEKPEGTIFIVPLKLDECAVPDRLSRWQWVDLFSLNGYERLIRALRKRASDLNISATIAVSTSLAPEAPSPSLSNVSGGVNLEANDVAVGQDVVGRDKVVSAGGHIIHAESGATVIINGHPINSADERATREKVEQIRLARESAEAESIAREKTEEERLTHNKAGQERLAALKIIEEECISPNAEQPTIPDRTVADEDLLAHMVESGVVEKDSEIYRKFQEAIVEDWKPKEEPKLVEEPVKVAAQVNETRAVKALDVQKPVSSSKDDVKRDIEFLKYVFKKFTEIDWILLGMGIFLIGGVIVEIINGQMPVGNGIFGILIGLALLTREVFRMIDLYFKR